MPSVPWTSRTRYVTAAVLALLFVPASAQATHVLVDASGHRDFTTLQAAANATIFAYRESILIAPGTYPETVFLSDSLGFPIAFVGTAGAAQTTLHAIVMPVDPTTPITRTTRGALQD